MKKIDKHAITFLGEFLDEEFEKEFRFKNMKYYSKYIGPVALIFGIIYMIFIIDDYRTITNSSDFRFILIVRIGFLMVSSGTYFLTRKIQDYSKLIYLITAYESWAVISFLLIIFKYESISFLSFFSVLAITFAIYIVPNRIILAQILSAFLNISFLILYSNKIVDLTNNTIYKISIYILLFLIFGNIEAYLTNFYRRKQFIDAKELEKLSITDTLTGIYNRARLDQELNLWVDYCIRYKNPLSLVIFDIDDFKEVNDKYGHLIGDGVLQEVTSIIKKAIRSTDIFARWGGDEFVILLPNTGLSQAIEMMERLRISIMEKKLDSIEKVTCSFGVVSLQENEDANSLLQRADKLLYKAKGEGKNFVSYEAIKC